MKQLPTISIIGPGKVGTSLGILAARAGYSVIAVGGHRKESTATAAQRIGKNVRPCDTAEAAKSADMIFLTLPDDIIEKICSELAQKNQFAEGAIIVHCSGALSSNILSAAREYCQCSIASIHPLQTFPTIDAAIKMMSGTYCFYEGDKCAIPAIENFARDIGLRPVPISTTSKTLYHAAAVTACNYFAAIMDAALAFAEKAGIDRKTASSALEPLIAATLKNTTEMGTINSLTGPIARGDVKTIRRHLQELASTPEHLASVYRTMGLYSVEMAVRKGTISAEKAAQIKDLLKEPELQ